MTRICAVFTLVACSIALVSAQAPLPTMPPPQNTPPPSYPAAEIERIVSPVALYPDPLLAQLLAAATFAADIPDAARWADEHHYLTGASLTAAIAADHLPWDPSVQALLPFPSVLDMMASAMPWTQELGDMFLAQHAEVMDAVQQRRQSAQRYGYLRSNPQVTVSRGPYVEIQPVDPGFIVVPYYDPDIVFGQPAPGFAIAGAIGFGFGVRIGAWFGPWGWGTTSFMWASHTVVLNSAPWGRVWSNRGAYVHPYPNVPRYPGPRLPDRHRLVPRTPTERSAPRPGIRPPDPHRG
jgi:Protein of unknown function (DUF3300)